MAKKRKTPILRTHAEKKDLVHRVTGQIKAGVPTKEACKEAGFLPVQFYQWRRGLGLGRAPGTATEPQKTRKKYQSRQPTEPITIEIPDTATMCVLYGPADKILAALQTLRG